MEKYIVLLLILSGIQAQQCVFTDSDGTTFDTTNTDILEIPSYYNLTWSMRVNLCGLLNCSTAGYVSSCQLPPSTFSCGNVSQWSSAGKYNATLKFVGGNVCAQNQIRTTIIHLSCNDSLAQNKVVRSSPVGGELTKCVYEFWYQIGCKKQITTNAITTHKIIELTSSGLIDPPNINPLTTSISPIITTGSFSSDNSSRVMILPDSFHVTQGSDSYFNNNKTLVCTPNNNGSFYGIFHFKLGVAANKLKNWGFKNVARLRVLKSPWIFRLLNSSMSNGGIEIIRIDTANIDITKGIQLSFNQSNALDFLDESHDLYISLSTSGKILRQIDNGTQDDSIQLDQMAVEYDATNETLNSGDSQVSGGSDSFWNFKTGSKTKIIILVFVCLAIILVLVAIVVLSFLLVKRRRRRRDDIDLPEIKGYKEIKEVEVGKRIGGGTFGDVYIGTAYGTKAVALKMMKVGFSKDFLDEAKLLQDLVHPNTVLFMGIYHSPKNIDYIVTEYCDSGSLIDYLHKKKGELTAHQLFELSLEAAKGMAYLESRKVVHRDLAARNLLVHGKTVKVADFGLSKLIAEEVYESKNMVKLPIRWSAPEVVKFMKFSSKSDSWSMGIVLYEIFTYGILPYRDFSNAEVVKSVIDNGKRLESIVGDSQCPPELWELMTELWKEKPSDRPTLAQTAKRIEQMMDTLDFNSNTFSRSFSDLKNVRDTEHLTYAQGPTYYNVEIK